jgi:hypothetical protein
MDPLRWISVAVAVAAAAVPVAFAEPPEKVVLAVDGADIYLDAGARDGVGAGSELELLHEVTVRDPRSGATLRDRFALGVLTVTKSGDRISVARAADELRGRVLAGDRVRLVSAARAFVDPWAERIAASRGGAGASQARPAGEARGPGGALIDHDELARAAWQDTLGKPPDQRIARWLALLGADPQSPYRAAIQREIQSLKEQIAERQAALANAASAHTDTRAARLARLASQIAGDAPNAPLVVAPLPEAVPGRAIPLAFVIREPGQVARAWLYVRSPGQPGFRRTELAADGDAYLRGTIPAEQVVGPSVQWYVEVAASSAAPPVPALGSQTEPRTIAVEPEVEEAPVYQGRSHIDAHVDYVDFDGKLGRGFDQYYQAEIDFTYRFLEPVHAVRLGFGTLSGTGGPKDIIDADLMGQCRDAAGAYRCKRLTFSYVYTELEHRLRPNVAVMIRPQAGVLTSDVTEEGSTSRCVGTSDIVGCEFRTRFGGRVRLRLGDEAGTNLVIGAAFTQGIGTLLEAAYHWRPAPVVPVQLSVQVTDQPVPEDFGVRLIADVGWRRLSWFYPSARLSYQARDIDHAGISGGFAMNFDW